MTLFREQKGIRKRKSGYRPIGTFYVIASEGTETEPIYFKYLQKYVSEKRELNEVIKIEHLERQETASSPHHVLKQLDKYKKKYIIDDNDELWLLIDRDRNTIQNVSDIEQKCKQKKYEFCLTSPCFELWLLLHLQNINDYSDAEIAFLAKNDKVNKNRTYIEKEVSDKMVALGSGYSKSNVNMAIFFPKIEEAIRQAYSLNLHDKWAFDSFCTRIHVLLGKILQYSI